MELEQSLQQYFGFSQFRHSQKEIAATILTGRDTLTLMSTGGGKSLCYQLPAVLLPGLTVVISPLISLMEDQVAHLVQQNILATWITHLLPPDETSYRLELVTINHFKLLYVSPERLQSESFCAMLRSMPISLVVVDEAHCISEWGHEFRPEYRQIHTFLTTFPVRPTVAAFTATATLAVAQDIVAQLQLVHPAVFHTSVTRTNLALHVIQCLKQHEKWLHLLRVLANHRTENGIIYSTTREGAYGYASRLRELAQQVAGYSWLRVGYYHAGLSDKARHKQQLYFQTGKYNLLCATTAFGMGIDKADIHYVIHTEHPNSLESYYQQVGRAGRDGLPSAAYLFYHRTDHQVHTQMIRQQHEQRSRERNFQRLREMMHFCESHRCRMQSIASYFGENTEACMMCDYCKRLTNAHPYLQSPLSSKELDIIHRLHQTTKQPGSHLSAFLTDFQSVCAARLQPESVNDCTFIPGCGTGWRRKYE